MSKVGSAKRRKRKEIARELAWIVSSIVIICGVIAFIAWRNAGGGYQVSEQIVPVESVEPVSSAEPLSHDESAGHEIGHIHATLAEITDDAYILTIGSGEDAKKVTVPSDVVDDEQKKILEVGHNVIVGFNGDAHLDEENEEILVLPDIVSLVDDEIDAHAGEHDDPVDKSAEEAEKPVGAAGEPSEETEKTAEKTEPDVSEEKETADGSAEDTDAALDK